MKAGTVAGQTLETALRKIKRNRAVAVRKIELQSTSKDTRTLLRLEVQALNKLERVLRRKHQH
jgi:hypothetical protein